MTVKFNNVTLAESTRAPGSWVGPSNVRMESERTTAGRKYIGARRSFEKALGNASGAVTFDALKECRDTDEAAALAFSYEDTLPEGNGTLSYGGGSSANAAITRVVTEQIGVTVRATVTIAFGDKVTSG